MLASMPLVTADTECLLVLLVSAGGQAQAAKPIPDCLSTTFSNLTGAMTPRGLRTSTCNNLSGRDRSSLTYTMYVYCGNRASLCLKQHTFSKCFEL